MAKRKNRGIHVKFRPERDCWEVIEYKNGKLKRHATGLGSVKSAEERLAEIIVERTTPRKQVDEITIGELIAHYIREHVPTLARQDTALKCFDRLVPFWGDLKLSDLKKSNVFEYIEYRKREFGSWQKDHEYLTSRKLKTQTVRRELEQLQAVIGNAYRENIINVNPYIWKPDRSKSRERWLTKKEAAALLKAARSLPQAGEYLYLFIIIGLYTGARSEAMSLLRWPQVDFNSGHIDFTKTQHSSLKKSSRVPMPRRLKRELLKASKRGVEAGFVIHENQKRIKSVKNSFSKACDLAGLKDVTPHVLRHTAVSWMMQGGVSPEKIGKYVGMSAQMVRQVYGHLAPEHLRDAIESYG